MTWWFQTELPSQPVLGHSGDQNPAVTTASLEILWRNGKAC